MRFGIVHGACDKTGSRRLRLAWLLVGLVLVVYAGYASPFHSLIIHTLFGKMDLSYFDFVLNTVIALTAFLTAVEFINTRNRLPIWPLVFILPLIALQYDPLARGVSWV